MSRNIRRLTHSEEFSNYYMSVDESEYLKQHGILGQKWGQRLYQNKDGSLTPLGRVHYGVGSKSAKQMHEKGYTLGDYEGYKSYKKIQKRSSFKDKNWKLKKEAANTYNEDIITDSAKRNASRDYYIDMHRRKPMIMALASKDDKQKISELADKYANSEEYRRAKEFLDKHKDEFINKPEEKKIDIQDNTKENEFTKSLDYYHNGYGEEYDDKYRQLIKELDPDGTKGLNDSAGYGRFDGKDWEINGRKYKTLDEAAYYIQNGFDKYSEKELRAASDLMNKNRSKWMNDNGDFEYKGKTYSWESMVKTLLDSGKVEVGKISINKKTNDKIHELLCRNDKTVEDHLNTEKEYAAEMEKIFRDSEDSEDYIDIKYRSSNGMTHITEIRNPRGSDEHKELTSHSNDEIQERYRKVSSMNLRGMSAQEIADKLDMSLGAVNYYIYTYNLAN